MALLSSFKRDFYELRYNMKFEFIKNVRRNRMLILFALSAVLALVFYVVPLLSGSDFPAEAADYFSTNLGFVNLILVLSAMFLGADAINREHDSKTALLVYPLPQRRSIVIASKYLTQLFTASVVIGIYYGITAGSVVLIYGTEAIPAEIWRSLMYALLYMAALLSMAFFFSSILNSPPASMTLTFFSVFLLFPILNIVLGLIDVDTTWIFTNYSDFITSVFRFPSQGFGPAAGTSSDLDFYEGIWYLLAYTLGFYLISLRRGMKKEVS